MACLIFVLTRFREFFFCQPAKDLHQGFFACLSLKSGIAFIAQSSGLRNPCAKLLELALAVWLDKQGGGKVLSQSDCKLVQPIELYLGELTTNIKDLRVN